MALYDESLLLTHPKIAAEWSDRNPFSPNDVTAGSHDRVWWKCKYGHEWQTVINNRVSNGTGCPYCSHHAVLKGFNDFATVRPELVKEWNNEKNGDLKPDEINAYTGKAVWWKCENGHEWKTPVKCRTFGSRCRICLNQIVLKGYNDLASKRPDFADEWSDKNLPLTPDSVLWRKHQIFWWKCTKCGGEFKAWLSKRIERNSGCPYCAGYKVLRGYNDLQTTDPEIAKDWAYRKNGSITPESVYRTSWKYVKWNCANGHTYGMKIHKRTVEGLGCPVCDAQFKASFSEILILHLAKLEGINYELGSDISELFLPDLNLAFGTEGVSQEKKEVQRKKQAQLKKKGIKLTLFPRTDDITKAASQVKTILKKSGVNITSDISSEIEIIKKEFFGKDYRATPYDGGGAFRDVPGQLRSEFSPNPTDLSRTHPDLCKEWSEKNFPFKPEDEHMKSNSKVWWKCSTCGYEWKAAVRNRVNNNTGCPVCAGKIIVIGVNDLASRFPQLAAEWSPQNGKLKPEQFTKGSHARVWWICNEGHEWQTTISNRTSGGGCPICARKPLIPGVNDLATTNPEMLGLWSELNGALKPKDIRASYHKQVWWKCPVCGNEYQAQPKTVINRARIGCKNCTTTVGRRWKENPRR